MCCICTDLYIVILAEELHKRDGKLKNLAIFGGLETPEKVLFKQNAFKKLVITC